MLNIFKKREKQEDMAKDKLDDYEEISEKKTSKLGYILLILMVIFIVSISQGIFSDLIQKDHKVRRIVFPLL
jgi:hypothetical protein